MICLLYLYVAEGHQFELHNVFDTWRLNCKAECIDEVSMTTGTQSFIEHLYLHFFIVLLNENPLVCKNDYEECQQ